MDQGLSKIESNVISHFGVLKEKMPETAQVGLKSSKVAVSRRLVNQNN